MERGDFVVRWTRPAGDRGVELKSEYAPTVTPRAWIDGPAIETASRGSLIGDVAEETRFPNDTRSPHFQKFQVITK